MNKHLNDGQLRAALDGELDTDELTHLESCAQCQSRMNLLAAQVRSTAEKLSFLSSSEARVLSTSTAWKKFNNEKRSQKETSMFRKFLTSPLIRYGASAAWVLGLFLAFRATGGFVGNWLSWSRFKKVPVLLVASPGLDHREGLWGELRPVRSCPFP